MPSLDVHEAWRHDKVRETFAYLQIWGWSYLLQRSNDFEHCMVLKWIMLQIADEEFTSKTDKSKNWLW